jgi:hypothetical protein
MSNKNSFFSHLGRKKVHFGIEPKSIEVSSAYFSIFSIDREGFFQFLDNFFQFEICLHSSVCFGAKCEGSV